MSSVGWQSYRNIVALSVALSCETESVTVNLKSKVPPIALY